MDKRQTAAVVVTYNRLPLLRKCIEKLCAQTVLCDILVVNNASTDDTASWLDGLQAEGRLQTRNTGANLGGAGGFNYGMRWAVEAGYQYLWVMDDDCLPEADALEKLLEADGLLNGEYGWLSSVALWTDGSKCRMNQQKLLTGVQTRGSCLPAFQATFVSLFLRAEIVREAGLPISEFFIWGDDTEYTRRISVRMGKPGFVVKDSVVVHAMKNNNGSNIALDDAANLSRYAYAYRNENYLYRQEGGRGMIYFLLRCLYHTLRVLLKARDQRAARISVIWENAIMGFRFNPPVRKID